MQIKDVDVIKNRFTFLFCYLKKHRLANTSLFYL